MVIAARRKERGAIPQALYHLEPQHVVIERNCPRKVSHFQVNMADPRPRIYRLKRHTHYATLPT